MGFQVKKGRAYIFEEFKDRYRRDGQLYIYATSPLHICLIIQKEHTTNGFSNETCDQALDLKGRRVTKER